ncbi:hypothetical protein DPMN_032395 [Dreissena polymorpha]|uniref:Uncharacterized protein n=1 Tax=Dreissena polymorpha TaxID=45954 RepID=A0A9D4RIW1_DREPO|nr:hypothetical protein DPMN_032395 [Dreissena polymorpha]
MGNYYPVVVTGIPIPVNVVSSVSAPPQLLGLPQGRGNGPTEFHRASGALLSRMVYLSHSHLPSPFPYPAMLRF